MNLKSTIYWKIFEDIWRMFGGYADVKDTEEYWREVTDSGKTLCNRYKTNPEGVLATDLVIAVIKELTRIRDRKEGRI